MHPEQAPIESRLSSLFTKHASVEVCNCRKFAYEIVIEDLNKIDFVDPLALNTNSR